MKVCFETFGCRLNRAEALQMEAEYLAKGWEVTEVHSEADLFVVRGCSVTRRAQQDCEHLIDHLRRKYPNRPVKVFGCIEDKSQISGAILAKKPTLANGVGVSDIDPSIIPTRTARAYLKVQDGCSGQCSFCIVPKFRGKSVSVPFTQVLDQAKRFIEVGYHEIVVTGCNLSLYASEGKRFPELMGALAELGCNDTENNNCRFRIGSLEPGAIALSTVEVMAEHENICRFLHIPVQSGSNKILTAMRRPYVVKDVVELVEKSQKLMPLIGLGCDIIAGFPGESEMDFVQTRGLLQRLPFSNTHIFPFSARPGTPAAAFPNALPHEVKHARAHELADLGKAKRETFAAKFLGKDVEIVIENEEKMTGWTSEYLACEIKNKARVQAKRKEIVKVRVTDVSHGHLRADFYSRATA